MTILPRSELSGHRQTMTAVPSATGAIAFVSSTRGKAESCD
jgi:hypothetical protein